MPSFRDLFHSVNNLSFFFRHSREAALAKAGNGNPESSHRTMDRLFSLYESLSICVHLCDLWPTLLLLLKSSLIRVHWCHSCLSLFTLSPQTLGRGDDSNFERRTFPVRSVRTEVMTFRNRSWVWARCGYRFEATGKLRAKVLERVQNLLPDSRKPGDRVAHLRCLIL